MPRDRLPPLNAIRAFEAAARLGSYVAASQALHVTQPAIGRHVKILEDWLGVKLFDRNARGVTLTAAGQAYYKSTSQALQILTDAGAQLDQLRSERWLRILSVSAFASRWLTPRITLLRALRPDLKIAIEPNASFTSVDARHADLGIAYGLVGELSGVKQVLIRPKIFPVCSPEYFAQLKGIVRPEDLAQYSLIHVDNGQWWNLWFAVQNIDLRVSADVSHVSNDNALALAERGHGIALATEVLVKRELEEGRLIRCVDAAAPIDSYQILTPQNEVSEDVAWFIDWIASALQEEFPEAVC